MSGPVTGSVARIGIAPVKALALVAPDAVEVTRTGVHGDRRYALLDARHQLANGKRLGPLVRIVPETTDDPETLVLRLPDGTRIGGEVTLGAEVGAVFYGYERPARVVEGPYADLLSEAAGQRLPGR